MCRAGEEEGAGLLEGESMRSHVLVFFPMINSILGLIWAFPTCLRFSCSKPCN